MEQLLNSFRNYIANDLLYLIIVSVVAFFIVLVIGKLISIIIKKILRPVALKTKSTIDDKIVDLLSESIYRLTIVLSLYIAVRVFRSGFHLASNESALTLIKKHPILISIAKITEDITFVLLVFIILLELFKLVEILFDWYAEKIDADDNRNLIGSLFPLLKKISKIILAGLAVVIVLAKFKIDISGFVVSLGVGSLAIALAAQETLSNMISGFIIMADRPFRIGDRIRLPSGIVGDVSEIGIRSTKLMDFDNNIMVIPNNEIVKSSLVNISYPNNLTRVVVEIGVAYGSDVKKVKQVMLSCCDGIEEISSVIPPEVFLISFGDSSINFRLAVRTDDYKKAFALGCLLREKIYEAFNNEKIEIPFPQRVVQIKKDSQ